MGRTLGVLRGIADPPGQATRVRGPTYLTDAAMPTIHHLTLIFGVPSTISHWYLGY
jgi:hypothetical protein